MNGTRILFAAIFAVVAVFHLSSINTELNGIGGDNAYYILLGKSLATGQGYTDIGPGGVPHVHFQPAFPLLIAFAYACFGMNFVAFHTIVVVCELVSVIILFLLLRRLAGPAIATIVAAVFVLNPFVNISLVRILTEFPYLAITALVLFLAEKSMDRELSGRSELIWLPVLVLAAYFTRAAAVSLIFAFVIFRLGQKQWKPLLFNIPVIFLPILVWKLRQILSGREAGTMSHVFVENSYDPGQGTVKIQEFLFRGVENVENISTIFFQYLSPYSLKPHPVLVTITVLILFIGFVAAWKKYKASLINIYVPVYVGMLLVWPFNDHRKLLPIVPFVLYYFFIGIRFMTESVLKEFGRRHRQSNPARRAAQVVVLAGLLTIGSQFPELILVRRLQAKPLYYPPVASHKYEGFTIDWSHFGETYFWLRAGVLKQKVRRWADFLFLSHAAADITCADAIIVSRKPSLTGLYSNRRSLCFPFYTDHERQRTFLLENHVDYVIIDGMFTETYTYLLPYIKQNRHAFTVIKMSNKASLLRVFREKL